MTLLEALLHYAPQNIALLALAALALQSPVVRCREEKVFDRQADDSPDRNAVQKVQHRHRPIILLMSMARLPTHFVGFVKLGLLLGG